MGLIYIVVSESECDLVDIGKWADTIPTLMSKYTNTKHYRKMRIHVFECGEKYFNVENKFKKKFKDYAFNSEQFYKSDVDLYIDWLRNNTEYCKMISNTSVQDVSEVGNTLEAYKASKSAVDMTTPTAIALDVGNEDISILTEDDYHEARELGEAGIVPLIKKVICNKYHSKNGSVKFRRGFQTQVWMRKDGKWISGPLQDAFGPIMSKLGHVFIEKIYTTNYYSESASCLKIAELLSSNHPKNASILKKLHKMLKDFEDK